MLGQVIVKTSSFHWLDVVNPTPEELGKIAKKYGIHKASVQDCLDSEHLPKHEQIGNLNFAILRAYDETSAHDADTVQELTRKVAFFFTDAFLITIHRIDQDFLVKIKETWKKSQEIPENPLSQILYDLVSGVFISYQQPIDKAFDKLEELEMGVFEAQGAQPFDIQEGYYLKRKASVFKRMIRVGIDLLPKINGHSQIAMSSPDHQDLRELADSYFFYSDELTEGMNSLLNLYISMASQKTNEASHRTNEVVRVLTIFSVFLLPLNLLTGIYGMNFEHMPELKSEFGYPTVLFCMVLVATVIYFWFRKKGWLKEASKSRMGS